MKRVIMILVVSMFFNLNLCLANENKEHLKCLDDAVKVCSSQHESPLTCICISKDVYEKYTIDITKLEYGVIEVKSKVTD